MTIFLNDLNTMFGNDFLHHQVEYHTIVILYLSIILLYMALHINGDIFGWPQYNVCEKPLHLNSTTMLFVHD